jgi:phosphohistidine phosphatase
MLVGHQPSLGEIAGEIIWGTAEHFLDLKKGGACLIELEHSGVPPSGTLVSLLTPSVLRKISV